MELEILARRGHWDTFIDTPTHHPTHPTHPLVMKTCKDLSMEKSRWWEESPTQGPRNLYALNQHQVHDGKHSFPITKLFIYIYYMHTYHCNPFPEGRGEEACSCLFACFSLETRLGFLLMIPIPFHSLSVLILL